METTPRPLEQRIKGVRSSLASIVPAYGCGVVVFLVKSILPELLVFRSGKETLRFVGAEPQPAASTRAVHRTVAAEAASLHAPLVADAAAAAADVARSSGVTFEYDAELDAKISPPVKSILAIPVLDPDVYQPSPMMRPVIGVVSFGTLVPAADVIRNVRFQEMAERLASGLVAYARTVGTLEQPAAMSFEEVVVAPHEWIKGDPVGVRIEDGLGREWYGFRPGRYADGSALEEFKSVQSRRTESEQYLRSLKIQAPKGL